MDLVIIGSADTSRGKLFEIKAKQKRRWIMITWHAFDGAADYNISTNYIIEHLINSEEIIKGHSNRFIAHKKLNQRLARIVYEYEDEVIVVITFYMSHTDRYYRGGIYEDKILP